MDFRMYDNALGRFYGIDKLAEAIPGITPFHFGYNNPIMMSDPSGLLSQDFLQSLWNNSSNSGWNTWSNQGGDFFNDFGNIGVNSTTGNSTFYESLPNITISSSFSNSQRGVLIQDHVYKSASGYQYFRDGLRETQLDNLQSGLDIIGMVPIIGEPFDLINAGISYSRGNYVEGSLSLAATIPLIGVGATVSKVGYGSFSSFKRAYGTAGKGNAWHHIVEQHSDNIAKFGAESIHNMNNLIKLPHGKGFIHAKVTGYYNSLMPGSSMRVRDYVKGLSYEKQYQYGIDVLKRFGWKP